MVVAEAQAISAGCPWRLNRDRQTASIMYPTAKEQR